jgi:hypothetical protein
MKYVKNDKNANKSASERKLWLGFYIHGEQGPCLRPHRLELWKDSHFRNSPPEKPFYYKTDALAGLACVHLNQHLKNPFALPHMNYSFCFEAWRALEPHHELYERSQPRVAALRQHMKEFPPTLVSSFEQNFRDILGNSLQQDGIDLDSLTDLIESIDYLEAQMEKPLLYNFNLKMSREAIEKLHYLHSLLFNLRALVAMDYNAFVQDPAHEAVKVDSISDYLSKAEYVANDAVLYCQLKKQRDRMSDKVYQDLLKSFWQYSHNGACLIENLPKSFLNSLSTDELGEALYVVQMDWLLGTDAGLLFRIREELFALREGYDKIFWPELQGKSISPHSRLMISCELTDDDIYPGIEAA